MSLDDRIFVRFKGRTIGPLTLEDAKNLVRRGQITALHELSSDGVSWRSAKEHSELFPESPKTARELNSSQSTQHSGQQALALEAPPRSVVNQWYVHVDGSNQGPLEPFQLKQWIASDRIDADTLAWQEGMADWLELGTLQPELFAAHSRVSATATKRYSENPADQSVSPKLIAAALRARGWAYFTAVLGIAVFSTQSIFWLAMFLMSIAGRNIGASASAGVIVTLACLAVSIGSLVASIHLLRYAIAVGVLRFQPNVDNTWQSLERLATFWKYTGIFLLVALAAITLLLFLAYVLGLSLAGSWEPFT